MIISLTLLELLSKFKTWAIVYFFRIYISSSNHDNLR